MTGETPTNQTDIVEASPEEHSPEYKSKLMLLEGSKSFAANISKIIETEGISVAREYIKDLLSDTEGRFPESERMAVFEILANEQNIDISRNLINEGRHTLETLINRARAARETLDDALRTTSFRNPLEMHSSRVESTLRRNQGVDDYRKAAYHTEVVADDARRIITNAYIVMSDLDLFAAMQSVDAENYHILVGKSEWQSMELAKAKDSLRSDSEVEKKELVHLINPRVIESVLSKIQSSIEESKDGSASLEDAICSLATNPTKLDYSTKEILLEVQSFLDHHGIGIVRKVRESINALEDSRMQLLKFNRNRDEYFSIHRPQDAIELANKQQQLLEKVSREIEKSIRNVLDTLDNGDRNFRMLSDRLATASVVTR